MGDERHVFTRLSDVIKNGDQPIEEPLNQLWASLNHRTHPSPTCWTTSNLPDHGRSAYTVATIGVYILGFFHITKVCVLLGSTPYTETTMRDLLVSVINIIAVYMFWVDVTKCRVYEGLLRLIAVLFLANILLPSVWCIPPPMRVDPEEGEEEQH